MGACTSSNADSNSAQNTSKKAKDSEYNVILLGTHQSGKTTLGRQLLFSHGGTLTDLERSHLVTIIHNNIINTLQTLCQQAHQYGSISIDAEDAFSYFLSKHNNQDVLDDVVISWIRKLWNEQAIRSTYENRHGFYLRNQHNVQYFLDKFPDVARTDYVPTDDDIVRIAIRTTAFSTISFPVNGITVNLQDVGGLRSERQRWPQSLSGFSACLYVINISEFDERLLEDKAVPRLTESLRLFQDLAKEGYWAGLNLVLVFTHMDIFEEKLVARHLGQFYPDFHGTPHDVEEAKEWVAALFTETKAPDGGPLSLHTCFVNALDQDRVRRNVSQFISKPTGSKPPQAQD